MAIVTRWFAPTAGGLGDGTSPADPAALVSGGAFSTIITGFNYVSAAALECRLLPGAYACGSAALTLGTITGDDPDIANQLVIQGCDSAGGPLEPSNPDWTSDTPVDFDTGFPELTTLTRIFQLQAAGVVLRCLKIVGTGGTGNVMESLSLIEWCNIQITASGTSVSAIWGSRMVRNSRVSMEGTSYFAGINATIDAIHENVRIQGNPLASTGTRRGINGTTVYIQSLRCCVFGNQGDAANANGANTGFRWSGTRNVFHGPSGNAANGVVLNNTASQTLNHLWAGNHVSGFGLDGMTVPVNARGYFTRNRLRNNGNGALALTYPEGQFAYDNDESAGTDAAEFVDAASGDYRIKYGSAIWGKGYGVSDEPAPTGTPAGVTVRSPYLPHGRIAV